MASVETAWFLALKCTADRDVFTVTPIYTISDEYEELSHQVLYVSFSCMTSHPKTIGSGCLAGGATPAGGSVTRTPHGEHIKRTNQDVEKLIRAECSQPSYIPGVRIVFGIRHKLVYNLEESVRQLTRKKIT
jgi:hypothetical protein